MYGGPANAARIHEMSYVWRRMIYASTMGQVI